MEGVSVKGIRRYWCRRSGYERLHRHPRSRQTRVVHLGDQGTSRTRRRSWRVRLGPRLKLNKLRNFSPKKLLLGLRDAYVSVMMKIAHTRVAAAGGGGGFGSGCCGDGLAGFGQRTAKEYDERMIVEIYKSIVMTQGQGHLMPRDAKWVGSEITSHRPHQMMS